MKVFDILNAARADSVIVNLIDGEIEISPPEGKGFWIDRLLPWEQELRDCLEGVALSEPTGSAELNVSGVSYLPFPIHTLPKVVGEYVGAAADAIGCDPSYIALPMLAASRVPWEIVG